MGFQSFISLFSTHLYMGKFSMTVTKTGGKGKGVIVVTIRLLNIKADRWREGKKITNVGGNNQKKNYFSAKKTSAEEKPLREGDAGHSRVQG